MKILTRRFWQIFAFIVIAGIGYAIVSETLGAIAPKQCNPSQPAGTTCCCTTHTGVLCCSDQAFCGYIVFGCNCRN